MTGTDGLRAISSTVSPSSILSMCDMGTRHWRTPARTPKPGWRLQWLLIVSPVTPTLRPPLAGLQKPPAMNSSPLVEFSPFLLADKSKVVNEINKLAQVQHIWFHRETEWATGLFGQRCCNTGLGPLYRRAELARCNMPVKIRYTPKGTRYEDWSKATPLEELELYRQLLPKNGFVSYSPHPKGPRANTAGANPAASSGSSRRLLRLRRRRREARRRIKADADGDAHLCERVSVTVPSQLATALAQRASRRPAGG